MTKRLVIIGVAVMTTLLVLVLLWQFRVVVVYVLISLAFAAALRPLFNRLSGQKLAVRAPWILLYVVAFGSFGILLFFTFETMINEVQQLTQLMGLQDKWLLPLWLKNTSFQQVVLSRLPAPSMIMQAITGTQGQNLLPALLGFTQSIGSVVSGFIEILFLSLYWSINKVHFERLWFSLLPSSQRKQARSIWRTIEVETGVYVRGELILSLLAGLLTGLGCWLLGSPYPAILALTVALICLIPVVGNILAILPVLLVGLTTSVQLSLFSAVYVLAIMIALSIWVKPRLFNRRWDNPILSILLMIVLIGAFGIIGIIVAPPLSVICQILWSRLLNQHAVSGNAVQLSDLKERQAQVLAAITALEEPPLPLVTNSLERLSQLLEKAEPILQASLPPDLTSPLHSSPPVNDQRSSPITTTL